MKDFKWIVRENIPCWYELSYLKEKISLMLRVHKDFAKTATVIADNVPIIKHFLESFKFSEFAGDLQKDFGFDHAFSFNGINGDFMEFLVPMPIVRQYTENKCSHCQGTGTTTEFGGRKKCGFCSGTGKQHIISWHSAQAVSASLNVFFSYARNHEHETSSPLPQLMVIDLATNHAMGGSAIGGDFSIPLCEWLKSFDQRVSFPDIKEAMQEVHKKMFSGIDEYEKLRFRAYMLRKGGIVLDVPGDACGIFNDPELHEKKGCEFSCHNVDTPMQQLELLTGLAVLHDKAKKT